MKTVYFVSSRFCSDESKYIQCLLHHNNMTKDGTISLKNNNAFLLECVRNVAERYNEEDLDKLYEQNLDVYDLFIIIRGNNASDKAILELIKKNIQFLVDLEIIQSREKHTFKEVYKLNSPTKTSLNWVLYSVHEIDGNTDRGTDIELIRSQWCDILTQYIFDHVEDVTDIHLILHDKDIAGYSNLTEQMIAPKEECCENELINKMTLEKLGERDINLDISFFKHDISCISDIIGPNDNDIAKRIDNLDKMFEDTLNELRAKLRKRQSANKMKK